MCMQMLSTSMIERQRDTQARVNIDEKVVQEYIDALKDGAIFPPIKVFFDSTKYYIGDGWHRFLAHINAHKTEIECEIIAGTKRDAMLFALGANASHGLRRTNADKRKAVLMMLNDEEWQNWSSRKIAEACKVSDMMVLRMRNELLADTSTSGGMKTDTSNIGGIATPETRTFVHPKTGRPTQMNISNMRKPEPRPEPQPPKIEYVEPDEPEEEISEEEYEQERYNDFKEAMLKEIQYYSREDNQMIQDVLKLYRQAFAVVEAKYF